MNRSCRACGGIDHARKSSKKCKEYLPPVRKRNLNIADDCELQVYTVKRGLSSLVYPLLEPAKRLKLLSEIRRDVRDLSRVYVKLGVWINFYMKTATTLPVKPEILLFLYAMKGCGPYADAYSTFSAGRRYDGKLRSFVVQELAKQYETVLHTNIGTHAYSRLARHFKVKRNNKELSEAFFKKQMPEKNEEMRRICYIINADTVKGKHWWGTVPEWLKIQESLRDFRLFPQPSHGLKHVTYTSRGWHELIRRVEPASISGDWTRIENHIQELWSPWLEVNVKRFGCCLQADGISASLSMNRIIKRAGIKRSKPTYDRIIAVDPGSRLPVAAVDSKLGRFERITRKYVRSHTLEWKRNRVRSKLTGEAEAAERRDRERLEFTVSSKNTSHVVEYTAFRLKWFDARQEPYERHSKLTRLRLDKYMRTAKCEELIIKQVFDGGGVDKKLVLYGAGSKFMNTATFSGRKFKHDSLIRRLKSKRDIDVEIVDEAYTSQVCSACNEKTGAFHKVSMNHKLCWGVCPNCNSEFDRDANAAKNILVNYKRSTLCRPGCPANWVS